MGDTLAEMELNFMSLTEQTTQVHTARKTSYCRMFLLAYFSSELTAALKRDETSLINEPLTFGSH